jgi:putative phosphoribosyl transferase
MQFTDRRQAGLLLGRSLQLLEIDDPIVLGLPRGGVPVAFEVAQLLGAPLDVLIVRKIGVPFQPELAMGAVAEGGAAIRDETIMRSCHLTDDDFLSVEMHELTELERRANRYRHGRELIDCRGRRVVIVDDGIATGSSALAAIRCIRERGAAEVTVAAPVCSSEAETLLRREADRVHALVFPDHFLSVGYWYEHFESTHDEEVDELLRRAQRDWEMNHASTVKQS